MWRLRRAAGAARPLDEAGRLDRHSQRPCAGARALLVLGLSHGRAWKPLVPCRHEVMEKSWRRSACRHTVFFRRARRRAPKKGGGGGRRWPTKSSPKNIVCLQALRFRDFSRTLCLQARAVSMPFHDFPCHSMTFHAPPRPSTAFHDLPRPSMPFHALPWPSMPFQVLP